MAESILQVPPDSSGQKLRVESLTVGANTVLQQVITLADSAGNLVGVTSNKLDVNAVIANGSDVTQGAIADSAYAGSGSASIIAILKGLYALLAATLTFKRLLGTTTVTGTSVTTSSTQIIAANASRKALLIINNSTQIVYINAGTASAANTSIAIQPNGGTFQTETSSSAFQAIVAATTASITVVEDA